MRPAWSDLTMVPSDAAVAALRRSWAWLVPGPFTPSLFSALGDAFLELESGGVHWLDTGTGTLSRVADSVESFRALLGTEAANDWFLPDLIEQLHAAGKTLGPGRCYTYVILPIFTEGRYDVSNLNPVPAEEHFALTGEMHERLAALPDGTKVRVVVVP